MEELIARVRARDPEAFCDLMRRYKLPMYKVAKGILYSDEDVADAMHQRSSLKAKMPVKM